MSGVRPGEVVPVVELGGPSQPYPLMPIEATLTSEPDQDVTTDMPPETGDVPTPPCTDADGAGAELDAEAELSLDHDQEDEEEDEEDCSELEESDRA